MANKIENKSFDEKTGSCFCTRCGYQWTAKSNGGAIYSEPKICANKKCKSKGWNKPRVYGGKYLGGARAMAQRDLPTGRLAARLQKEQNSGKSQSDQINEILDQMEPDEREAAVKFILIHKMAEMLRELGLK